MENKKKYSSTLPFEPDLTNAFFYATTDKEDSGVMSVYDIGDIVNFTVTLKNSIGETITGVPTFAWTLSDEAGTSRSGTESGVSGMLSLSHTITVPGFVRLTVKALDACGNEINSAVRFNGGACAAIDQIVSAIPEPVDYDDYWTSCISELYTVEPTIIADGNGFGLEIDEKNSTAEFTVYNVYINCVGNPIFLESTDGAGDGATYVAGKLTVPVGAQAGSLKIKVRYQGAGVVSTPGYSHEPGYITFYIYAHSIALDREQLYYTSLNSGTLANYAKREKFNNTSGTDSYVRYMVLRAIQAIRFVEKHFGTTGVREIVNGIDVSAWRGLWDGKTIVTTGESQGGFQAIAAAALYINADGQKGVTSCLAKVPNRCDLYANTVPEYKGRRTTPSIYPGEGKEHQKYYDTVYLAWRLECPTEIWSGFGDDNCPAIGIVSAYNGMSCPKQLYIYQGMGHKVNTTYNNGESRQYIERNSDAKQ